MTGAIDHLLRISLLAAGLLGVGAAWGGTLKLALSVLVP